MRNLIPSPLRSVWAFIGYLLIFIVPVWKVVSFLGDVGFVMGYAVPVGNFFATGWGIASLIVVGFGCLVYANYRLRPQGSEVPTPPKPHPEANKASSPQAGRDELKQLRTKLTEAERKSASDKAVIEKQQHLDRFDGDRQRFKELLMEALLEGRRLRENEPSDDDVEEWKGHVRDLLEAALGKGSRVESVVKDDPTFESAVHGSTSEQKQIERSTNRLHDLIEWVKSPQAIPFRSGFDPHKWEDWKSLPLATEQARIDQLQAA